MIDYSKLSDRDLDVEVAKAMGCKPEHLGDDWYCGCDGAEDDIGLPLDLNTYSTSWQYAGPLLEMMPRGTELHSFGKEGFECTFYSGEPHAIDREGSNFTKPTRAICEAFLKWRDVDPEGFKKGIE